VLPRIVSGLVALLLVGAMVTGCSGQPAPEPSTPSAPTFATDEEAFAAAEETYRAYVDATNAVDLADPATFASVFTLLTDDAAADARKQYSQMHAEAWRLSGARQVVLVAVREPTSEISVAALNVCLDVSDVEVVDPSGKSVVNTNRPDVQSIAVELTSSAESPTGLLITSIDGRDGEPTCDG
jgi:hypothetical protein